MFPNESVLECADPGKNSGFVANRSKTPASIVSEPARIVPFNRPDLAPPMSPVSPLARQAVAGAGLLTILLFSCISLLCYSGVCRALSLQTSIWVMLAIFAAATVSGVAGFAFSAICGAMLFHLVQSPISVVETMIVCSIAIQLLSVATLKNAIDPRHLGRFLAGGIVGLPVGVYLLTHVAGSIYMECMGVFLIGYGVYMLVRKPGTTVCHARTIGDYFAGFLGGITGGFAAFPGAFVTIWCGLKGLPKDQQRGVYQPFILIMQILALAALFFVQSAHRGAGQIDPLATAYIPAALLGTWCGIAIFRRLTEMQFAWSVNVLLVVSGVGLVA
jgi:uncharacterized membrane protein YfcA